MDSSSSSSSSPSSSPYYSAASYIASFLWKPSAGKPPPPDNVDLYGDDGGEDPDHFLSACCGCRRRLPGNRDIFMYRGDMAFCSEECRLERIEADEVAERAAHQLRRVAAAGQKEMQRSPKSLKIRV